MCLKIIFVGINLKSFPFFIKIILFYIIFLFLQQDLGLEFNVVAESFETSVPWKNTLTLCRNVKYIVGKKCKGIDINIDIFTT